MAHSNSTSGSRRSSSPWSEALRATDRALCHRSSSRTTLWFLSLLLTWTATAQSRKDLEKKRDQLDKQIKTTSALISAGEKEQRATQRQLELLQAQIRQRQELIGTMNSEVFRVDKEIGETEELIEALGSDLARLKEEYARMLQYAYMNRDTYDRLSYLFAARSFTQAFQRSRYLDQLADRRRQQAALITDTQASLERRADDLKNRRTEKVSLLNEQVSEREKLSADRGAHESTLSGLRRQEDKLRGTLREQKSRRERIAIEIKRAIEAEVRKSAKPAKGGTTSGGAASSGTPSPASCATSGRCRSAVPSAWPGS